MYFQYRNEKSDIKLNPIKYYVMQWHMQVVNIAYNLKTKIYLNLPEFSATKMMTWKCHIDDSAKCIYNTILGRYPSK